MERIAMMGRAYFLLAIICATFVEAGTMPVWAQSAPQEASQPTTLVLVLGASGEETYDRIFAEELVLWRKVAESSQVKLHVVGAETPKDGVSDKDQLHEILNRELKDKTDAGLWIVFIGHGTFDGRVAAFNLRGPDLTNTELAEWLKGCERPLAVINTTAASAPFLTALSHPNRVIITATKSGQERNYARFGRYFARRVIDPEADLDKDEQTSLFEAFLAAAQDTTAFYAGDGRLATEHPLLDDNGDGRGVRPEFFVQGKPAKIPSGQVAIDGDLARRFNLKPSHLERSLSPQQAARRDELEVQITLLRRRKSELAEDDYYADLEKLLVELSRVYESK